MFQKNISVEKGIVADLFVKQKEYWLNKMSGELVWSHFPYDYQGKDASDDTFDKVKFKIEGDTLVDLEKLISGSNSKLHMVLTTALAVLLYKYSGNEDIILGTPIDKQKTDANFINTVLVLRNRISDTMTFKELLLQMKQTIIEAIENQNYPFDALLDQLNIKYDENGSSFLDVALLVENIHDRGYLQGIKPGVIFSFLRARNEGDIAVNVNGIIEYNSHLYEIATVKRLIDHFIWVLGSTLSNLDAPLSEISLLSEDEKKRLIYDFNDTATDYPWNKPVHELFEEQAVKTPNNTALVFDDQKWSYGELNFKKNRLAALLGMKGVTKGNIVGIMSSRSFEVIAAILGVLKAGGAYLPIDTQYPENRKKYILEDSGTTLLLTDRTLPGYTNWKGEIIDITGWAIEVEKVNVNGLENIHAQPGEPSDLAYVIYTSGSTGKPKGVMIEHRGLVNYVWWAAGNYVKNRNTLSADFPLYTSISFDLTVTSIFTPLITGGKIIIYGDEVDVPLEKILKENKVRIVKLTPTHLKLIGTNDGRQSQIDCFIVGGEELETRLANDIHNLFAGKVEIYNEYGPTEATVGCMIYRFNHTIDKNISVPIGHPSANARVYILDKNREPVPVGVTGEIYISGNGVARGYLNHPELTADRFMKSPFELGHRLYRTGDLGRFMTDGNIEFKGRQDNQVKIRGHRIELGEIQNKLSRHKDVKDVLVTIKETKEGDKFICAYIIITGNDAHTIENFDPGKFRDYLAGELPDYMLPAYFIKIEKVPLTPNGKLDVKALPDPLEISPFGSEDYIPPKNELEKDLVQIWQKVLGRQQVGTNENFFMIGGDSIKSIQVLSRMNQFEYKIEMRELFQNPTIAQLALKVKKFKNTSEQFPIVGQIPLTPIQKWFFEKHQIDIHHFNQSVMFYSRDELDEDAVKAVFTKIHEHHDALRMTYKKEENSRVVQFNHGLDYPFSLEVYDFRNQEDSLTAMQAKANAIQAGIDLGNGPLMKLGLFHMDDGHFLLIAIHHLVVDAVSWRILFEDIDTLFQQYKKRELLSLPLKTESFKVWAEKLSGYANSETFLKEKAYWAEVESLTLNPLEHDFAGSTNFRKDARALSFSLDEQETTDLLTKVNEAFGTDINQVLLAALAMGIKKTWKHDRIAISLEGHGREEIMADVDIGRTIGWFTSSYPLVLDVSFENDLARQIKEVKEAVMKIPNKGIAHGILKYLTSEENKKDTRFQLNPQFGFNYLGQFDADIGQLDFEIANQYSGDAMSPEGERETEFDVSGMIANNRLVVTITYNQNHFRAETVGKLRNHFHNQLIRIMDFCLSRKEKEASPSDFTFKGLSIETVDRLTACYDIEDIYTLTPMQEGMLFHALVDERSYSYFEQTSYRLQGKLGIGLVEKSLNELVKRHEILRTAFVYQDIERSVQVVLKNIPADFYYEDISKTGEREEKENYVREFKAKDKERGFDLTKGSLLRVSIIEVGPLEYEFTWSFHHILMDGWCIGILNADFFQIYNAFLANRPHRLPAIKPYRTYIQWLEKQDKQKSALYWQNYLDSYEEQARVPKTKILTKEESPSRYRNEQVKVVLDREKTANLNELAAGNHVTLNIVAQTLWGILLGKYNRKEDVVFGSVVSGRPFELEGVESMVGLFINTVPVRIRFEANVKFSRLLQQVQEDALACEPHHYHPLAEIQSTNALKQNLIDHLFIFENYPISEQIEGYGKEENKSNILRLKLANVEVFEQTNYDFNVLLEGSDRLGITFQYNGNVYDADFVERIAKHFSFAIDRVIENPELKVGELRLLSEEEKSLILYEFNDTEAVFPRDKTIHQLFEEQAERTPDRVGLVGDVGLSYNELNKQSDVLAQLLIQKGVLADDIVGIMMERSVEMIIGIFGILKAGGAYLPIDPEYPQERIDYMLKDSNTRILLGMEECQKNVIVNCKLLIGPPRTPFHRSSFIIHHSNRLAYIIYTSGSTGKPKGVMIDHTSIVNLLFAMQDNYSFTSSDTYLLKTSYIFDVSVTELFGWYMGGGRVAVLEKGGEKDPCIILNWIERYKVSHINFVPSMFNAFVSQLDSKNRDLLSSLKFIFLAGEALLPELVNKFRSVNTSIRLENIYGPTESSVYASKYSLADWCGIGNIPIGRPLPNIRLYILNEYNDLQPVGIPGQLCIRGTGLARGYLNRPELTAEKFKKYRSYRTNRTYIFYKTGDLARFLSDGNIEFLGRIDHQVKIRGFRVELGEIENCLLKINGVKEAVTILREEVGENKYICAYIVSDKKYGISELRESLSKELPGYMIPSYFVQVQKIPLTPNGKVDRGALPGPKGISLSEDVGYMHPSSTVEKELAAIWRKVLGRNNIGINENFFMIGGDSIKSIQIISRMNSAGYKLEMKDLFQYPVIADLAPKVKKLKRLPDQSVISGTIPLTPIQGAFFIQSYTAPHHYNQAVMLYAREGFDKEAVEKVFSRIQEHHDALRMTYERDEDSGQILQVDHGLEYPLSLEVYDFRNQDGSVKALEFKADEIQAGIDLAKGPLMKLGLFHLDDGDRLLIVIHHLVIDGISWRILFEDIETLYNQYRRGETFVLPPKTDSFKLWAEKLSRYANGSSFLKEKGYWSQLESNIVPGIPMDFAIEENIARDTRSLSFNLGEAETALLLTGVNHAFKTEINDILLTALGLAMKKTFGQDRVLIALEGHGREDILDDIDISRTVGWFTSVYPVLMDIPYAGDLGRQIKEIKETLRRIPNKGIGCGILKYLTAEEHKKEIEFKLKPQISFNYLGQFDEDLKQMSLFKIAGESSGNPGSSENHREYELDINGLISQDRLFVTVAYNHTHFKPETMAAFANHFQSELCLVITFCSAREKREFTPSDFTYKGLTIENVNRLIELYPDAEDIYTLTPMQEGMLFYALADERSYSYFEQMSYRLHGELDICLVEKSLNVLFKRHEILRTAFVYQNFERALQVVLSGRVIDFYYEDIAKHGNKEAKEIFIAEFKEKDKKRSFDLSKDVLTRVSILRVDRLEYEFTWSFHHIVMDGWCVGILNTEFFEIYTSYLENRPYRLPVVTPFRTYIQWLEKQDKEESARYWQKYLDSYEEQVGIPKTRILTNGKSRYQNEEISVVLAREKTAALNRLAAANHVTLNTLTQALWGILLGKYNGKDDVLFGSVVSGRPFELEGVESILGLFINTIPVRIRFEGNMEFYVLLHKIQEDALASEPYHYHPLADIQSMSVLKQHLIDHIFIFENYPIAEQIEGYGNEGNQKKELKLKLSNIDVFEQTNFDFNVMFLGTEQIKILLRYNGNFYDKDYIKRIGDHLNIIIDQVITDPSRQISDIEIISEATRKEVLNHFNENLQEKIEILPIQSRLADVFRKYKTNTAIECGPTHITYARLEHRAACISQWITGRNIPGESFIGIYSENKIAIISAIIGILQRRCVFVPLGTALPGKRVESMIRLLNMQVIVTDTTHETIVTGMTQNGPDSAHICTINDSSYRSPGSGNNKNPGITYDPEDKIYVYFTSGTTGAPNAIVGRNKSLVQFLQWEIETFAVDETYRVSQLTTEGFDPFLRDVFVPLLAGGAICIPGNKEILLDGNALIRWLDKNPINLVHCVPSLFRIINSEQLTPASFPNLKYVLLHGEPIKPNELHGWFRIFNQRIQLGNYYGPTETTMAKIFHFINLSDIEAGRIPVGRPIRGSRAIILDKHMKICGRGIIGEIYIRTAYSTHGYLNNPELNAQRFLKNPFSDVEGDLIYKTGDLGRELQNGEIEVLGRIDRQVKIRGVRIELENIENCLLKHSQIEKPIVMSRKAGNDENYLCAYIVYKKQEPPVSEKIPTAAELREFLAKELPNYMIPSHFIKIETIPLTANGKIDRRALEKIGEIQDTGALYAPPTTEMEKKMAGIWAELLKLDKVSINDNFFELGGNSLTTLAMTSRLKEIGWEVTLGEVLANLTVKTLAAVIDAKNISPGLVEEIAEAPLPSQLDCIEKLNKGGNKKNIFIIHPLHGMVNPYKHLAELLETEYNVYGVQARGLKPGAKMSESPGQMIADYIEQILSVQKEGPYILGGYCIGTIIAYEIAVRLERMGRTVERLILFDSRVFFSIRFAAALRALDYSPRFIKKSLHRFQERKFKKAIRDDNPGEIQAAGSQEMTHVDAARRERITNNMRVFRDHMLLLEITKAPILVLLAEASVTPGTTEANFSRMSKSKTILIKVPGDHDSIFEKPNVENLAEAIKKTIIAQ